MKLIIFIDILNLKLNYSLNFCSVTLEMVVKNWTSLDFPLDIYMKTKVSY